MSDDEEGTLLGSLPGAGAGAGAGARASAAAREQASSGSDSDSDARSGGGSDGGGGDSSDEDAGFSRRKRPKKKRLIRRGGKLIAADSEQGRAVLAQAAAKKQAAVAATKKPKKARAPGSGKKARRGGGDGDAGAGSGDESEDFSEVDENASGGGSGGEDDEEDSEEDSEEDGEYDAGGRGGARKRRRAEAARFFEEAAEEGEGSDEEEGGRGANKRSRKEEKEAYDAAYARLRAENERIRAKKAAGKSAEDVAKEIEQRHRDIGYGEREEEAEDALASVAAGERDIVERQANLPDMRDPRLWMMRCKDGAEAEIMVALTNKFIAKASAAVGAERLGIMSAVSTGKGVIFVEAFREAHVKAAVTGIADLYSWKDGAITLVPLPEMTRVVEVRSERAIIRPNQFVRMTAGLYKGDLGQVLRVYPGGRLLVRMVPRLNLQILSLPKEQRPKGFAAAGGGRGGARPPQRFFDKAEILELSGGSEVIERRIRWERMLDHLGANAFENGMLLKEVKRAAVTTNGAAPTLDEISKFKTAGPVAGSGAGADGEGEGEEGGAGAGGAAGGKGQSAEDALVEAISSAKAAGAGIAGLGTGTRADASRLAPGDPVQVVRGDLAGLSGTVVVVNGSTFTMQPSSEASAAYGLTERLEIALSEVVKTFRTGDHVKVMGGVYIGETGTVIATSSASGAEGETALLATVLLDSGMKQVQAFVRDLTLSAEVVTSMRDVEGYQLYDLVETDGDGGGGGQSEAGVIVGLGQRDVTVLLPSNTTRNVPVHHLRGKISSGGRAGGLAQAVDMMGDALATGDIVTVSQGEFKGASGTIKHIHRVHVFLYDFKRPAHAGIFAARARTVALAGARAKAPGSAGGAAGAGAGGGAAAAFGAVGAGRGGGMGARGGPGGFGGRPGGVDDMVGRQVRITKGLHKGLIGTIKSATPTQYRVELNARGKTLPFPRDAVREEHANRHSIETGAVAGAGAGAGMGGAGAGGLYGAPGAATPAWIGGGGMTPALGLGGGMGAATPAYGLGGQTPFMGAGGGSMTPGYGAGMGSATPMYGGSLPPGAGGARTPMISGYGGAGAQTPAVYGAGAQTPYSGYGDAADGGAGGGSSAAAAPAGSRSVYGGIGAQTPAYAGAAAAGGAGYGGAAVPTKLPSIEEGSVPWWVPGVRVDIVASCAAAGAYAGGKGTIAAPLHGGAVCRVNPDAAPAVALVLPTVDLRPQLPQPGQLCYFVSGHMMGTKGQVISEDHGEYVVRVGDLTDAGNVEFFPGSTLVALAGSA